jgi:hypothetical protein
MGKMVERTNMKTSNYSLVGSLIFSALLAISGSSCSQNQPNGQVMQAQAGQMLQAQAAQNQNAAWQAAYTCQTNFTNSQANCRSQAGTDQTALAACANLTNPCSPPPGH